MSTPTSAVAAEPVPPSDPYVLRTRALRPPLVLVHGGAGPMRDDVVTEAHRARLAYMEALTRDALAVLRGERALADDTPPGILPATAAHSARYIGPPVDGGRAAVLHAVAMMELDERFNAGRGAKLQADGRIRTSAALADGTRTRLAGVYGVLDCLYASQVANALLDEDDRNLDGAAAAARMRQIGLRAEDLRVAARVEEWRRRQAGQTGTVGAVALDGGGQVWACTATGGRGHETPGRVSDTPTPAGTYACPAVALSATGIGEEILDLNLCGRMATRMLDGQPLHEALRRTFDEVAVAGANIGVIAVTPSGEIGWAFSTAQMATVAVDAAGVVVADLLGHGDPRPPTA